MNRADITGVLLAGGLARRMGGGDKGLVRVGDSVLAALTLSRLSPQVGAVVVNANRNESEYAKLGAPVVGDVFPDFAGPLAGIHAGMVAAETEWVLSAPCDSPFLPDDLAEKLFAAAMQAGADIATASAGGRAHPVFTLARKSLHPDLESFLTEGGRKIDLWHARHKCATVDFPDESAFANINTPEDLQALL